MVARVPQLKFEKPVIEFDERESAILTGLDGGDHWKAMQKALRDAVAINGRSEFAAMLRKGTPSEGDICAHLERIDKAESVLSGFPAGTPGVDEYRKELEEVKKVLADTKNSVGEATRASEAFLAQWSPTRG